MALPANFWEEFDRRLDRRLDERLDRSLAPVLQRLDRIEERLDNVEKQLDSLKKRVANVENWTKRQDRMLERETTMSIYKYLEVSQRGFYVFMPNRYFPRNIVHPVTKKEITDLDGVIVLTTDRKYEDIVNHKGPIETLPAFRPNGIYKMIIIEAKQHLTMAKYTQKKAQRERIINMIRDIRSGNFEHPLLSKFGIEHFEPEVGLFVGAIDTDDETKKMLEADAVTNDAFGYLDYSGARFSVYNRDTDFGKDVSGISGGRRRAAPASAPASAPATAPETKNKV